MSALQRFVARRILFAATLVFVVSSAALLLGALAPGDITSELVGSGARPETIERQRAVYGLDQSMARRYVNWLGRAIRLDLGVSSRYSRPVTSLLSERAGNTIVLAGAAILLATAFGVPLGVISAGSASRWIRASISAASVVALSLPPLLTSLLAVVLAARTGWFPVGGVAAAGEQAGTWDFLWHLFLPAVALALPIAALLERLQSQATRATLSQPYVTAAVARGVPRRRLLWRHIFVPSLKPVLALYGTILGTLLSGSLAVEIVMAWPGLGRLMYEALVARDIYLVAGCAAAGSLFLAAGNLLSDLALAAADPRVRDAS